MLESIARGTFPANKLNENGLKFDVRGDWSRFAMTNAEIVCIMKNGLLGGTLEDLMY